MSFPWPKTDACNLLIFRNRPGGAQMDTEPSVEQVTNSRLRPRPFPGWVNQRTCLTHLKGNISQKVRKAI